MKEARLKVAGLFTNPDPYSEVPEGALSVADNVVIDRDGLLQPRRGFTALDNNLPSSSDRAKQLTEFKDTLIAHYATTSLAYYSSGWQAYSGSYTAPTGAKMRFFQSNGNLYFTTTTGVKKLATVASTPATIGVPQASTLEVALASGSWLSSSHQVAYRVVWGIRDANENVILGAPCGRVVLVDSGGPHAASLTITIPADITTSHFYQVYRSKSQHNTDPGDELFLVHEANPTSGEISAKSLTITDETAEALLGASLYSNASQEGILQLNTQPPLAVDATVYKNHAFYANTIGKYNYTINLLGTGSPNGLQADDTIIVAGTTYTAKGSTTVASGQFKVFTAGSASQNITDTALELIKVINQYASNTLVYAYYMSGPDDLPGQIRIEERGFGGSVFTVQVSRATAWSPSPTTAANASNDTWQNAIFFSKSQQPEAVPLVNYVRVGSADDPIKRIISLRDSLFIFKETEGIYRLYGDNRVNFQVDQFDSSARLLATESLAVLNNQIYGLFDQGVCKVSETGVQVISRPIEKTLLELQGDALSYVKTYSWAVAYESDRKYILHLPADAINAYTTQAFVWNTFTSTWTRWSVSKSCGFVRPSEDILYVGAATNNKVSKERKTYSFRDHVDEAFSVTITAVSTTAVTLSDVNDVEVGDILYASDSVFARITAVNTGTGVVTVDYDAGFSAGAASVLQAYTCTMTWAPFTAGQPLSAKQFSEFNLLSERSFDTGTLSFATDLSRGAESVTVTGRSAALWGLFPWGTEPWGGNVGSKLTRVYVPSQKQRGNHLEVTFAQTAGYTSFSLAGAQVKFRLISERTSR